MPYPLRERGVYAIINEHASMAYIGATSEFVRRWRDHRKHLVAGKHAINLLQEHWNERGIDAFVFIILEVMDKKAAGLHERERHHARSIGLTLYNPNLLGRAGAAEGL
jgi:group I intron endonuclease